MADVDDELVQNLNHIVSCRWSLSLIIRRVPAQKMQSLITPKNIPISFSRLPEAHKAVLGRL
jgi:hypothetical protein